MLLHEAPTGGAAAGSPQGQGPRAPRGRSWLALTVVIVAVVLALVAALVATAGGDDGEKASPPASSAAPSPAASASTPPSVTATTAPAPTKATTATSATTSSPATAPADTSSAVWPTASGPVFTSPVAAARGFAVDFVGFRSPIVGAFRQGDSRSGEVDVRAKPAGPVTTVLVRQLGGGGRWFVLGSLTSNLQLSQPAASTKVSSPLRLRGTSTAFEANVSVEIRQDGARQPIGTGTVMGGSMGEMGPFDGTVAFRRPSAKAGAVLLLTYSAEDGRVWEASTVRVAF